MIIQREQFFSLFGDPGPQAGGVYLEDVERRVLVALARHVRPQTVIEIGVQDGQTARCVLSACPGIARYLGIDLPPGSRPALAIQETEIPKAAGVCAVGKPGFEVLLADTRKLTAEALPPADLIFIDGGHDYLTVKHDTELAMARIRPGGVVVWHDYNAVPEIGVRRLVDEFNQTGGNRLTLVQGTWMVFRFAE